jgi:hypothetical protein
MRASELTIGRTFGVTFDHGEDFLGALARFCKDHEVRQGYLPMFIGAFSQAEIVGARGPLARPDAPLWDRVRIDTVEALGGGHIGARPSNRHGAAAHPQRGRT